jgi:hypothetical protein
MMNRYSFDIRVHSAFKRTIKPNRLYIEVAAANHGEALALATAVFRQQTLAGPNVDLRYLARGVYGPYQAGDDKPGPYVISMESRDWVS